MRRLAVFECRTRGYDPETREVPVTIMTSGVARDGLRIDPRGWLNPDEYMRNPVVFLNHNWWGDIVANTVRHEVTDDGINVQARIARTPTAEETLLPLLEDQMIHAASIGWQTVATEKAADGVETVTQWRLYEWSLVTIPSDPAAMSEYARSRGLPWIEAALSGQSAVDAQHCHHTADGALDREALLAEMYAAHTGARGAAADPATRDHLTRHYEELGLTMPAVGSDGAVKSDGWSHDEKRLYETRNLTQKLTAAAQRLTGARDIMRHWEKQDRAVPETVVSALRQVRDAAEGLLRAPAAERELRRIYDAMGTQDPETVLALIEAL